MKKSKIILLIFLVGLISGFLIFKYVYKDHRDISTEQAKFELVSKELLKEFSSNSATATNKYLDQTIKVSGKIQSINEGYFSIDELIICYTDSLTLSKLKPSEEVVAKGRCIGYDDLLGEIKLDQVTIAKK